MALKTFDLDNLENGSPRYILKGMGWVRVGLWGVQCPRGYYILLQLCKSQEQQSLFYKWRNWGIDTRGGCSGMKSFSFKAAASRNTWGGHTTCRRDPLKQKVFLGCRNRLLMLLGLCGSGLNWGPKVSWGLWGCEVELVWQQHIGVSVRVLPPASTLSIESSQKHFLQPALLNFFFLLEQKYTLCLTA